MGLTWLVWFFMSCFLLSSPVSLSNKWTFGLMIFLPMSIVVGFLLGIGEMDNNSGQFSLLLIATYWWLVKLLPVLGDRILSLILAPPWSGIGDNTGYCQVFTVQEFPRHHRRKGVMVTYSKNFVLLNLLFCLLCDETPIHPSIHWIMNRQDPTLSI